MKKINQQLAAVRRLADSFFQVQKVLHPSMYCRFSAVIVAFSSLASCANLNVYEGFDAALIPVPCQSMMMAEDGKTYERFIEINEVDGSFIGSGRGCKYERYTYRIKPGVRQLKIISNFANNAESYYMFGVSHFSMDLQPAHTYLLDSRFDGKAMRISVMDAATGNVVAQTTSTEVNRQHMHNQGAAAAGLMILRMGK